ncbi:hypothetical protein TrLO_g3040 [Triparma laevis f. longispina]|uniref:Uncharacterized protein n=1 Tax=Triparma laevis f. longispina TaxID=1714387 RepID=A0A9W7E9L5_9STRA|nr:hypothetical protein TrLO_g3040 [Triparma laevis f. longispina]
MTYLFFNTDGQEFYGQVNAWLIGLTIFLQILLSNFQNTKKSNFLRDALYGFRPALDAYRVGSGAEKEDHQVVEPLAEMSACKYVEVAFGTIPALHVQIFAILRANDQKVDALISILVSAATIGFTSSMISYDWDLSPTNRANNPLFCGYIPDSALKRAACFFSMMWLTVSRVLLLSFTCTLLALMDSRWFVYFLCADMFIFLLYKIVTKDGFYFLNFAGAVRFMVSVLIRVGTKTILNFTLLIHLRHSQEVGSVPFIGSLFFSLGGSFVAAYLFTSHYEGEVKIDDTILRAVLGSLYAAWIISATVFVLSIKRKFLATFFNTLTASQFKKQNISTLREDQDNLKSLVFYSRPDIYACWGDELLKAGV